MKTTIRTAIAPLVRPIWSRVWHRIEFRVNAMIERRFGILESQMVSTAKSSTHLLETVRALSNTLLTQKQELEDLRLTHAAVLDLETAQRNLEHRVEFVRREILYEFKYGWDAKTNGQFDDNASPEKTTEIQWKIKNEAKAAEFASQGIRLNLGCGLHPLPNYVNVDLRDLPEVDIVAAVDNLPFEENTVQLISSSHLIEHFPQERLVRRLLPYWKSLLRPGGAFHAIVPDCAAMIKHANIGDLTFEEFREVIFGSQDYAGDYHYNALTPSSFSKMLNEAGFENIEIVAEGRRNGLCYEFEIECIKPI